MWTAISWLYSKTILQHRIYNACISSYELKRMLQSIVSRYFNNIFKKYTVQVYINRILHRFHTYNVHARSDSWQFGNTKRVKVSNATRILPPSTRPRNTNAYTHHTVPRSGGYSCFFSVARALRSYNLIKKARLFFFFAYNFYSHSRARDRSPSHDYRTSDGGSACKSRETGIWEIRSEKMDFKINQLYIWWNLHTCAMG